MTDWLALNKLKLYKSGTNQMSTPLWKEAMKKTQNIKLVDSECTHIDHTDKNLDYLINEKVKRKIKRKF